MVSLLLIVNCENNVHVCFCGWAWSILDWISFQVSGVQIPERCEQITINGWHQPSKYGWCIIALLTLNLISEEIIPTTIYCFISVNNSIHYGWFMIAYFESYITVYLWFMVQWPAVPSGGTEEWETRWRPGGKPFLTVHEDGVACGVIFIAVYWFLSGLIINYANASIFGYGKSLDGWTSIYQLF